MSRATESSFFSVKIKLLSKGVDTRVVVTSVVSNKIANLTHKVILSEYIAHDLSVVDAKMPPQLLW
jgi:hypothetical protein